MFRTPIDDIFSHLKNNLLEKLKIYYRYYNLYEPLEIINRKANEKLQEIIRNKELIDDQYNALLRWSADLDNDRDFNTVKDAFKKMHDTAFAKRIAAMQMKQEQLCNNLNNKFGKIKQVIDDRRQKVIELDAKNSEALKTNINYAISIINNNVEIKTPPEEFEHKVNNLKLIANRFNAAAKQLIPQDENHSFSALEFRSSINIKEKAQKEILKRLNDNIVQYESHLKAEPWYKRIFNYFSTERRSRIAAIKNYKNNVLNKAPNEAFHQAKLWASNQFNNLFTNNQLNSRFQRSCINPFLKDHDQYVFESLSYNNLTLQTEITSKIDHDNVTIDTHNKQIIDQNNRIKNDAQKILSLNNQIKNIISKLDNVNNIGNLGYGRNHVAEVNQEINKLSELVATHLQGEASNNAMKIANQLETASAKTAPNVLNTLLREAKSIKNANIEDSNATIDKTVKKVINDTHLYGGKGNNYCFMGTANAEKIVMALGSKKQIKDLQDVKNANKDIAKMTYERIEEEGIAELKRSIETGTINSILQAARILYLKHKGLNGHVSDEFSENLYQTKFKSVQNMAFTLHKYGKGLLKNFVNELVSTYYLASTFNENRKSKATPMELLNFEEVDTLVILYGDEDQYSRWNNGNHLKNSSLILK